MLLWFVIEQFHIQNVRLLSGNWEESNLGILSSKSSEGLKPYVDFFSGYPGVFNVLISQTQKWL